MISSVGIFDIATSADRSGPTSSASSAISCARSRRICRSVAATSPGRGRQQQDPVAGGEQDVVGGERPVRDPVRVQPEHVVPDPAELGVGRREGEVGQRRAVVMLVGEHGRLLAGLDQGAEPGHGDARVLGRVREQRQPLDRAVLRQRRPARHLPLQPHQPVQPVEQPGRLLVPVVHEDVEPASAGVTDA